MVDKSRVEKLHNQLIEYATLQMDAVLDGVEVLDPKLFSTYLGMIKHDDVKAISADTSGDEFAEDLRLLKGGS